MSEQAASSSFFDQVRLFQRPPLRSPESWEKNVQLVQTLCEMADSVEWSDAKVGNVEAHIPHTYHIDGATVKFSPSWSFISIAGMQFDASLPQEVLQEAVQSAGKLELIRQTYPISFRK